MPRRHIVRTNSISQAVFTEGKFDAIFPGWGDPRVVVVKCSAEGDLKVIADTSPSSESARKDSQVVEKKEHHVGLTTVGSVSIAGCDLLASCLYTAGVCTKNSGKVGDCFRCIVLDHAMLTIPSFVAASTCGSGVGSDHAVLLQAGVRRGGDRHSSQRWDVQRDAEHVHEAHRFGGGVSLHPGLRRYRDRVWLRRDSVPFHPLARSR